MGFLEVNIGMAVTLNSVQTGNYMFQLEMPQFQDYHRTWTLWQEKFFVSMMMELFHTITPFRIQACMHMVLETLKVWHGILTLETCMFPIKEQLVMMK